MGANEIELDKVDKKILLDIYDMFYNNGKEISCTNYELNEDNIRDKEREFAYHLMKLKNQGYINFEEKKVFKPGGMIDEKYNNNNIMTFPKSIKMEEKGKVYVEKLRMTKLDKVKGLLKKTPKAVIFVVSTLIAAIINKIINKQ
jgi:hypothetical protein